MAVSDKVCSVSLRVPAGKVTPAPSIASVLGQRGVNLMKFCKECSEKTSDGYDPGEIIFVRVSIFNDKTFSIEVRGQSMSQLLLKAAGVLKGSSNAGKKWVAEIPMASVVEIAKKKLKFMTAYDLPAAINGVVGTAKSMGIKVSGGS